MIAAKKLSVLLPGLYGGGAERTILNLANGIADRGYPVDLVLIQAEGPYLTQVSNAVRLVDLGQGHLSNRARTLTRLPALVRYMRSEQPDAMLSALSRTNLAALWARRLAGVTTRIVVNEQANVSEDLANTPNRLVQLWPYLIRYFYRWADSVIGVSQGVVEDLVDGIGVPRRLVRVIYNPAITPDLRQNAQAPLDHPWFQPGEPPLILAVGRLTKQKDFPTLIKAFAQLRQTQQARLLILGEGSERQALEALVNQLGISQDVCLPGFVANPYPYMVHASAFVLSSLWEGLPTVLMEALYCGVPIVATDCPSGPREILRNGEIGRLVPMGDSTALHHAMAAVLSGKVPKPQPENWQPYTLETVVDQYLKLLLDE